MPKPNLVPISEISQPGELPKFEVKIVDKSDPRSVINLVPNALAETIELIAKDFPHYLMESEDDLQAMLQPPDIDDKLRISFWKEYNRAQDHGGRGMIMKNVYGPICHHKYFYAKVVSSPQRLAWILNPPENYMLSLEASLNYGKNTLNKIMKMDLFNKDGSLDVKKANVFLKAYELLDNRVRGSIVQRIEQRTLAAHIHSSTKEVKEPDIQAEVNRLRAAEEIIIDQQD